MIRDTSVTMFPMLFLVAFTFAPAVAQIVDVRLVNTSIAFGTFTPPPGFGPPQTLVFAGTLISTKAHNDASAIQDLPGNDGVLELVTADPIFPDMFDAQLAASYGLLNNHQFLTGDLTQFGNSGAQLLNRYQQLVADLQAANPGVTFIVPPIVVSFIGTKVYSLFGGTFPNTPSPGTTTAMSSSRSSAATCGWLWPRCRVRQRCPHGGCS